MIDTKKTSFPVKILNWIGQFMAGWVILAGLIGYFKPDWFIPFKSSLQWFFFFTMLGVGAVMKASDFLPVIQTPRLIGLGLLAQFLIMPLAGFLLARALGLPPALILGAVLVGAVPGAMASNVIAYIAKTDVAYSIALTSSATILAPVLTPFFTKLYVGMIVPVDFVKMFFIIIKLVILPLTLGIGLRRFFPETFIKAKPIFPAMSSLCIALICGVIIAVNHERFLRLTGTLFFLVFLHNLIGLIGGYLAGKAFRFDQKRCRTLCIEVGMQNAGLGAVLAIALSKGGGAHGAFYSQAALVPAVFASWCVITASVLATFWRQKPKIPMVS